MKWYLLIIGQNQIIMSPEIIVQPTIASAAHHSQSPTPQHSSTTTTTTTATCNSNSNSNNNKNNTTKKNETKRPKEKAYFKYPHWIPHCLSCWPSAWQASMAASSKQKRTRLERPQEGSSPICSLRKFHECTNPRNLQQDPLNGPLNLSI